jgi:hypothetical protein
MAWCSFPGSASAVGHGRQAIARKNNDNRPLRVILLLVIIIVPLLKSSPTKT